MRLMSVWSTMPMLPTASVSTASTHTTGRQSVRYSGNAT